MSEVAMHTFRGRTMQEAVAKLKVTLGPDAVIVGTRRGRDHQGSFVEITATGDELSPRAGMSAALEAAAEPPAMGGRRGATAAYARTAKRSPGAAPGGGSDTPFAERAAWLARQVALRQQPNGSRQGDAAARALAANAVGGEAEVAERVDEAISELRGQLADLHAAVAGLAPPARDEPPVTEARLRAELGSLQSELHAIRALLAERAAEGARARPGLVQALADRLVAVGVAEPHALELAERTHKAVPDGTPDDGDVLAMLGRALADDLPCTGPVQPGEGRSRVLAFVGPTGVGKTTTIAKVAARARILDGASVALVTVDTFRMAAIDQLARYADILECPLEVVKRPDDLPGALERLADYDLVLVDTTGRNPRAADQVNALARFFPNGWGGEMVLTVACSTRLTDLFATVDAFARLRYDMVCVTKTDETDALGAAYSVVRRAARPLAWLTDGQRVPEDIEAAEPAVLAARVVGEAAARVRLAG